MVDFFCTVHVSMDNIMQTTLIIRYAFLLDVNTLPPWGIHLRHLMLRNLVL